MREGFFLSEMVRIIQGELLQVPVTRSNLFIPASKLCTDTRIIGKGELFVALKGENFNGNDFVEDACKKGALGAIVDEFNRDVPSEFLIIRVKNTLKALHLLAKSYREKLGLTLIGITGSNGKTTVKELTASILSQRYRVTRSLGNFNNQIGVPLSILQFSPQDQIGILEIGMNQLGEIKILSEIVQPQIGIITNVHRAHIGFLGSLEEIARAKAEMIPFLNRDSENILILNQDDPWTCYFQKRAICRVFTFGVNSDADFKGLKVKMKGEKTEFDFVFPGGESITFCLPFPGFFNVYNTMAAAAVGYLLGISPVKIKESVESFSLPPLRSRVEKWKDLTFFIDCYNANPESTRSALLTLKNLKGERKIAVLGDMLELGEFSQELHEEIGKIAASLRIDALFTCGKFSFHTLKGANKAGLKECFYFENKEDLAKTLAGYLKSGDCVLIKGSRKMQMEDIIPELKGIRT